MKHISRQMKSAIDALRSVCSERGYSIAQTFSRKSGNYLDAVRVYRSDADKGHTSRAIYTARDLDEIQAITSKIREES